MFKTNYLLSNNVFYCSLNFPIAYISYNSFLNCKIRYVYKFRLINEQTHYKREYWKPTTSSISLDLFVFGIELKLIDPRIFLFAFSLNWLTKNKNLLRTKNKSKDSKVTEVID